MTRGSPSSCVKQPLPQPIRSRRRTLSIRSGGLLKLDQAAAANLKRVGYTKDNVDQLVKADRRQDGAHRSFRCGDVGTSALPARHGRLRALSTALKCQKHVVNDDYGNAWLRTHSAGSGPFTLNRWSPNELVILDANKGYVAGAPKMRRVIVRPCAREPGRTPDAGARRHRPRQRPDRV